MFEKLEVRDIRGKAEQGADSWGPGEIRPVERQENMERKGRIEKSDTQKSLLEI